MTYGNEMLNAGLFAFGQDPESMARNYAMWQQQQAGQPQLYNSSQWGGTIPPGTLTNFSNGAQNYFEQAGGYRNREQNQMGQVPGSQTTNGFGGTPWRDVSHGAYNGVDSQGQLIRNPNGAPSKGAAKGVAPPPGGQQQGNNPTQTRPQFTPRREDKTGIQSGNPYSQQWDPTNPLVPPGPIMTSQGTMTPMEYNGPVNGWQLPSGQMQVQDGTQPKTGNASMFQPQQQFGGGYIPPTQRPSSSGSSSVPTLAGKPGVDPRLAGSGIWQRPTSGPQGTQPLPRQAPPAEPNMGNRTPQSFQPQSPQMPQAPSNSDGSYGGSYGGTQTGGQPASRWTGGYPNAGQTVGVAQGGHGGWTGRMGGAGGIIPAQGGTNGGSSFGGATTTGGNSGYMPPSQSGGSSAGNIPPSMQQQWGGFLSQFPQSGSSSRTTTTRMPTQRYVTSNQQRFIY